MQINNRFLNNFHNIRFEKIYLVICQSKKVKSKKKDSQLTKEEFQRNIDQ